MSNPNNLIRPARLSTNNTANPNPQDPSDSNNPPTQSQINFSDLRELVSQITLEVLSSQAPTIVQAALNPNANFVNMVDQTIETQHLDSLGDLDRIPDVVKCLREFSGRPGEFNSWRKSVERILRIYEPLRGTAKYYGILNIIRNKIVGNADIALESHNTPLDWTAIAKCLTLHYADKRDVSTLEYQMTGLVQGNSTVQQFY